MPAHPTQLPQHGDAESQRIKRVFQAVDEWVEHDSGYVLNVAFPANRARDGTFLGLDVAREFYRVLYHGQEGRLVQEGWDGVIALFCDNTRASYLYFRFKFLIGYLEAERGAENVGTFIEAIGRDQESHWEAVPRDEQVKCAWQLLWLALQFHNDSDRRAHSFQKQIHEFFPPQPRNSPSSTPFSISLNVLESIDLRVRPTRNFYEHLLVEEDTVCIYHMHYEDIKKWLSYENNRAAKALGIAHLGDEIRASLYALYGRDEFLSKAEALEILTAENDQQRALCARFLELSATTQPDLLAYRNRILQKVVDQRRSWWPSLVRDLKKQSRTQPLHFYGAIFAIFFGICTVIQTVASVWALFRR